MYNTMIAKELKEILNNIPDNVEIFIDDCYSVILTPADSVKYDEDYNAVIINL